MESEFFKMDLFFFVTTTVVVLLGVLWAIVLYYVVKIVRNINKIVSTVQKEVVEISEDFAEMKKDVKEGIHEVREGITTAKNYTKMVAGAGIVRAVSGLFEAFVEEKENSKKRKKSVKK